MVVRIAGRQIYLWRAVDHEGEVLDILVQRRRDTRAALRLMRKLLKKQGFAPKLLITDKPGSYACAFRRLRLNCPHEQARDGQWVVLEPSRRRLFYTGSSARTTPSAARRWSAEVARSPLRSRCVES